MRTTAGVAAVMAMSICLAGAATPARAADDDPPCQADVQRLCALVPSTGSFVQGCLEAHGEQLSARCRKHVGNYTRDTEKLHGACQQDLARLCKKVDRPNVGGSSDSCLLRHRDALSEKCRETLDANSQP